MKAFEIQVGSDSEELITFLWELGTLGIVEHENSIETFFSDSADVTALLEQYPCKAIQMPESNSFVNALSAPAIEDPILAGTRFAIVTSASNCATPPDRIRIVIDAQNSFGSGSHESTQLVITALEDYLARGAMLVDVGCGSGVICAVAQQLGAAPLIACDTHVEAALAAKRQVPGVDVFVGSVDAFAPAVADIAVANISARVIDLLSDDLIRVLKPQGKLILSGFIAEHPPSRFTPTVELRRNDWCCWICSASDLPEADHSSSRQAIQPFSPQWW